ncbi:DUF397 domain-containing protein [Nocardiopsis sp. CNT312]|uniref:DUF397 domain-containing protein n=1 Tax=Nocardiopsis sp. CNT312 TaxID=1137268 RepID=UPI0004AD9B30|nr:DUF397 domain-containing protein [Nocardiopsis sp. CNT312]
MSTHEELNFFKSSYSGNRAECIEAADLPCGATVRDSKPPDAGQLPFPATEWAGFLSATLLLNTSQKSPHRNH